MKNLFSVSAQDKKPLFIITSLFVVVNLIWAFYSDNTWDDDCPGRFQNTLNAFSNPEYFVSLWNRPLFVVIFALPVQLGAWTIPVVQTFFSIVGGFSLYKVAKFNNLKFAYLAFPLLALQPFVFGVSKYAMTEPLAITLIALSLYLQTRKKWFFFALCGGLLPLARLELAVFFPFYIIPLLKHKSYFKILLLGIPGLIWAGSAAIIHDNLFWILDQTIWKESKENRYGHQNWDTYLSRYAYVVGPVLLFFSALGIPKILKNKQLAIYVLMPFLLGFFVYTLFSWKLNMGNAAGFLRNIIPISPYLALICLSGITTWYTYVSHRSIKLKHTKPPKQAVNWVKKAKVYNRTLSNGKFYGFILLGFMVIIALVYFSSELKLHHKLNPKNKDYALLIGTSALLLISAISLFLKRAILKVGFPICILIVLFGYTLIVEHPMANSSDERETVAKFSSLYNKTYLKERQTHVNHPWFFWTGGLNRHSKNMSFMVQDSLKKAPIGSVAVFETHYSHRLGGNISQSYLLKQKDWLEISRLWTPKLNFRISAFEKVKERKDFEAVHDKYIKATDSLEPTAFFCQGQTYLNKLKNRELAYKSFAYSVKIDSTYCDGFLGLGLVRVQQRKFKEAITFFNQGLKANKKHSNLLLNKGAAQLNIKQFNAAIKTFSLAGEINPKNHQAWFYLGLAYQQSKKPKKALKAYEKCLNANSKNAQAWYNVAMIQMSTKQQSAACKNIKKAADLGLKLAKRAIPKICGGKK